MACTLRMVVCIHIRLYSRSFYSACSFPLLKVHTYAREEEVVYPSELLHTQKVTFPKCRLPLSKFICENTEFLAHTSSSLLALLARVIVYPRTGFIKKNWATCFLQSFLVCLNLP